MVYGYFPLGTNVPYIEVAILSREKILCPAFVPDTGFSGFLKIDERIADELGIVSTEDAYGINANGEKIPGKSASIHVELEGRRMLADVFIAAGAPLVGIGLFSAFGYTAVVDCKNKTAHLESTI